MAPALTGVHFAHPALATRARWSRSTTADAPFTPTAPIKDPPNHAARPASARVRDTVFRFAMLPPARRLGALPTGDAGHRRFSGRAPAATMDIQANMSIQAG